MAICRALILHPEVLLFDEVTAALDPEMVREVLDVMLELADSGQTMLIVTHEMQFARAIADQVILLEDGGIVERSDDAERFFTNPTTERANSSCIRLNSTGTASPPINPNNQDKWRESAKPKILIAVIFAREEKP